MFKKRLALILSFFLLIVSSTLVAGSLVPRQSARAVKFSGNATTTTPIPTGTPTTGSAAADSFQRTVTSGWGRAGTGCSLTGLGLALGLLRVSAGAEAGPSCILPACARP